MSINNESRAGGTSGMTAAPKLKPMEEWNVGPIWAWIAGAFVVVGLFIFGCSAVYQSSHANAVASGPAAAGIEDRDSAPFTPGSSGSPTAASTTGTPEVVGEAHAPRDSKGRPTD